MGSQTVTKNGSDPGVIRHYLVTTWGLAVPLGINSFLFLNF